MTIPDETVLKEKTRLNKENGFKWQQRRHSQWTENYELYRDTVIVNRLTQRQTVNIPLMKETIRTVLAGVSERRDSYFREKDNKKQKEIFLNEYWAYTYDDDKLELKDIADKKQVGLYGRSFFKLNISKGKFTSEVADPQDILVDRYSDPANLFGIDPDTGEDTSRTQYVIHQHIYRTLHELEANPLYDTSVIGELKLQFATADGIIKSNENAQSLRERNQKMTDLGVPDIANPAVGETIVELNEHFLKLWDEQQQKFIINLVVTCDDKLLLKDKAVPLTEILGVNFFPFVSWADDIERTDIWSDGIADVVRTINKVLNAWFSQMIENRTLKNFGMNYYNVNMEGFTPQTFEAQPWGWYPIPAGERKIEDVVTRVEIDDLSSSLEEMNFLIQLVERSTAATAIEKGTSERNEITLGEVQLLAAKAQARISDMAKFYRLAWKEFGQKWYFLVDANADTLKFPTLYKKSYKGNMFSHDLKASDIKSEAGYSCEVIGKDEKEQQDLDTIQKLYGVKQLYPQNIPLSRILEEKLLDVANLTPEQKKEVMDFEDKQAQGAAPGAPAVPGKPTIPPRIGPAPFMTPQPAALPQPVTQLPQLQPAHA